MAEIAYPLIDSHCHLEGSIDPQLSFEILRRAGHPLGREREAFFQKVTAFDAGWNNFTNAVHLLDRCMLDRATTIEVVADIVRRAAEQNVKILEPTFAPAEFKGAYEGFEGVFCGDLRPFTEAVIAGVEEGRHSRDIAVGLRMLIMPRHTTDRFRETYGEIREHVRAYRDHLVGIDICTLDAIARHEYDERRLQDLCELARAWGLHVSAHAGEFYDARPVERALELGVERIGHGIQIADDGAVLERVRASGVTLEVCPISNYRTGALPEGAEHPLGKLLRAGVRVTINSDDQGVQGSSWRDDYSFAEEQIGLSAEEVGQCLKFAYQASFLEEADKGRYAHVFGGDARTAQSSI